MSAVELNGISIIAVDDDERILNLLDVKLTRLGYQVRCFSSGYKALEAFKVQPADIVLVDLNMPEISGLELLKEIHNLCDTVEVIVITGNADKESAIEALKLGAFDFFEKPPNFAELDHTLKRTARYQTVVRERDLLTKQVDALLESAGGEWSLDSFVGSSEPVLKLKETVKRLQANDMINVLITGESGTGKELIARAVHYGGPRAKKPFVAVNCAAIPETLAESKLFGHVKGAFTGATSDKKGCFEMADGGTLFLDEIGDMVAEVQAKFLRVLEDSTFLPVGASKDRKVDVRVIAATNSDLPAKVEAGAFRKDLYYRLECFKVDIPPLRQRREDIPALVEYFAARFSEEMGRPVPPQDPSFIKELMNHEFPGNVRELRNLVERAIIEAGDTGTLGGGPKSSIKSAVKGVSAAAGASRDEVPLDLNKAEVYLARKALQQAGGNMAEAARLLGINRSKLYRILG